MLCLISFLVGGLGQFGISKLRLEAGVVIVVIFGTVYVVVMGTLCPLLLFYSFFFYLHTS